MKNVLLAALCFVCVGATSLYGQNGKSNENTHLKGNESHTRVGKNVGKGSPLLQRQAASSTEDHADEAPAPASQPAPARTVSPSPAPSDQKKTVPAATEGDNPKE